MKNTKNLGLPIYDNPKSDLFKISDVNNAHTIIDETYEAIKNVKDHIVDKISEVDSSLENMASDIEKLKQGNIEIDLSSYAKKSDLEVKADKSYVDSAIKSVDVISQLVNYAKKTELGNKVDKVDGKGLSTNDYTTAEKNKLSGLTNYTHPTSHSATMITEDSTHRFVTDNEKSSWNNKSNLALGTTSTTAYRGDYGNTAYTHSQTAHAPSNAQKNSDITKAEIEFKLTGNITSHVHSQYLTEHQDLSNYALKSEIPTVLTKTSQLTNDSGFISSIPNEYITESELNEVIRDFNVNSLQQTPLFATKIEECTDTTKCYVLPDGYIYAYMYTEKEVTTGGGYTNLAIPNVTNKTDTSIWVNDHRISSSGVSAQSGKTVSNPIYIKTGDVVRIKGVNFAPSVDRVGVWIATTSGSSGTDMQYVSSLPTAGFGYSYTNDTHEFTILHSGLLDTSYIRFAFDTPTNASAVIITVNKEIVDGTIEIVKEYSWKSTGHAFVPNEYDVEFVEINNTLSNITTNVTSLNSKTETLEKNIEQLNDKISNIGELEIPSYWEEHIENKINTIRNYHREFGKDCFSFVLMTDTHYTSNLGKVSPLLAKKIIDECKIKYALNCGDIQTRGCHSTKDEILKENVEIETMFSPIIDKMLFVEGNHDGSYGTVNGVTYAKQLNENEMFAEYYLRLGLVGDVHFADNCNAYYVDDVANNVRYIGLNSQCVQNGSSDVNTDGTAKYCRFRTVKFMQNQFDFLINEALVNGLSDKWSIVIFAHIGIWKDSDGDYSLMVDLLSAYQNKTTYTGSYIGDFGNDSVSVNADFTNAKGTLVGYFSGHNHLDTVQTPSNAFKVITTRCDAKEENNTTLNTERVKGTTTEQSFDVFTVNKATKKIYATKIGAGSDRVISY